MAKNPQSMEVCMRIVKKYANRKLYDTVDKTYISMDRLAELIKGGEEVSVIDNQTGQDITVSLLSQLLAREKRDGDTEELADMLSGLLRKSGDTVFGYAKKYSSRWQGAMSMAEEELEKLAKLFLKGREMDENEKKDFLQGFKGQAEKLKLWIGEKVDQRVGDVLKMMRLVSREEFEAANAMVSSLEKRVQELEKKAKET
jgi:polyhydroxyalkanoate synthesis repressor PhaR